MSPPAMISRAELYHRIAQEVEADHGAGAGLRRRVAHGRGGGCIDRQRLFAVDRLARLDRSDRHLGMQAVRGGDGDDVDIRVTRHLPPVAGGARESKGCRRFTGRLRVNVSKQGEFGAGRKIEKPGRSTEGIGVALPHEAGPDQAHANCLPGLLGHCLFHGVGWLLAARGLGIGRPFLFLLPSTSRQWGGAGLRSTASSSISDMCAGRRIGRHAGQETAG